MAGISGREPNKTKLMAAGNGYFMSLYRDRFKGELLIGAILFAGYFLWRFLKWLL